MTPHLDDEALSALLDGEATAAEQTHGATCPLCSERLAQLRAVALAVGAAPAPVTDARRDATIAAALAASEGARTPAGDSAPVAMASQRRAGRRRDRLPSWAAAAAGVAVLAVSMSVLGFLVGRTDRGDQTAAGRSGPEVVDELGAGTPLSPAELPIDGGDLGALAVDGVEDLAHRIEQRLPPPEAGALREQSGPPPHSAASSEAEASDSVTGRNYSLESARPCEAAARGREPSLGRLVYAAEATVDGTPASVLGFQFPGAGASGPPTLRVVALATATCTELAAGTT